MHCSPGLNTSLGEKALLVAQFDQPEKIQKRRLRVVVTNIATHDVRFEMTVPCRVRSIMLNQFWVQ